MGRALPPKERKGGSPWAPLIMLASATHRGALTSPTRPSSFLTLLCATHIAQDAYIEKVHPRPL